MEQVNSTAPINNDKKAPLKNKKGKNISHISYSISYLGLFETSSL